MEEIKKAIGLLAREGNLAMLLMKNSNPFIADAWIVARRKTTAPPGIMSLGDLLRRASGRTVRSAKRNKRMIGILPLNRTSWMLSLSTTMNKRSIPLSYTYERGKIRFFEGITGGAWTKDTNAHNNRLFR